MSCVVAAEGCKGAGPTLPPLRPCHGLAVGRPAAPVSCDSGSPGTPAAVPPGILSSLSGQDASNKRHRHAQLGVKRSPSPPSSAWRPRRASSTAAFQALLAVAEACRAREAQLQARFNSVPSAAAGPAMRAGSAWETDSANWQLPLPAAMHVSQSSDSLTSASECFPLQSPAAIAVQVARALCTLPPEEARRLEEARAFLAGF